MLERRELLVNTKHMSMREQVLMFLHLLCHNLRFRVIGERSFRSTQTIHSYFHIVLGTILKLYPDFMHPPSSSTLPKYWITLDFIHGLRIVLEL